MSETSGDCPPGTLDALVELVGFKCLAYLCAASTTEMAERLEGESLEAQQERSLLSAKEALSSPAVVTPTDLDVSRMAAASVLTTWNEEAETSFANLLHVRAGGDLPEVEGDEPIAEALGHLARDNFVALLLPGPSRLGPPLPMGLSSSGPWNTKLQEAVLADSDLGDIFKGPVDGDTSSFALWSSTGRGESGVQLVLLGSRLLGTPAAIARAWGLGIEDFMAAARRAASDMRTLLIAGEPIRVPAIQGLDGLVLPAGAEVPTKWGILRPLKPGEEALISDFKGAGNAVIEMDCGVSVSIQETTGSLEPFEPPEEINRSGEKSAAELQEAVRMIGLAVLLAKDLSMPAHIGARYTVIADPFSWIPVLSGRGPLGSLSIPCELSRQEVEDVKQWVSRIEIGHHDRMAVAVSRTISAHERRDPTDAFVDALIAWDALFGSTSNDAVTFRVATGFALLLAETEEKRRLVKKRASYLYGLRSKIVHGSIPRLDWTEGGQYRKEAVEMLLQALRCLYGSHPELLEADDRTNELLMRRGLGGTLA